MKNTVNESLLSLEVCSRLISMKDAADWKNKRALDSAIKVFKLIDQYTSKHDLALSCGGEWMYQSDRGQIDALALVSKILDRLSEYAEADEDDEEWSEDDDE